MEILFVKEIYFHFFQLNQSAEDQNMSMNFYNNGKF